MISKNSRHFRHIDYILFIYPLNIDPTKITDK